MDDLEFITNNALMLCDQGGAPGFFKVTSNISTKMNGCLVATEKDGAPLANIPSFIICKLTQKPCMPATAPMTWQDTGSTKIQGAKALIGKSTCQCSIGGKISFKTSGQIPLPAEDMEAVKNLQKEGQKALDDSGNGNSVGKAGDWEGMIPLWGSGKDMINSWQTGDVWGSVINGGFGVWDGFSVATGIFSFGAGTAAMQTAKGGLKATIKKGLGKVIGKKAIAYLEQKTSTILKKIEQLTGKAVKEKKLVENPKLTKAEQLDKNNKVGKRREVEVKKELNNEGHEVLGSQVSVKTQHTRRVVDHLIKEKGTGSIKAIEVKSGGATRSATQILKDNSMLKDGGKIIGNNAPTGLKGETLKIETIIRK